MLGRRSFGRGHHLRPGGSLYDHQVFLETLSGFSSVLLPQNDVPVVLRELAERVNGLLDLAGSEVTLATGQRFEVGTKDGAPRSIPLRIGEQLVGEVGLHAKGPRDWSAGDLAAAGVLANLAAAHLIHDSHHRRQRSVNAQLQWALDNRVVVEQAKGMVAGRTGCTPGEAYERIRTYARSRGVTVHAVADAIINRGREL